MGAANADETRGSKKYVGVADLVLRLMMFVLSVVALVLTLASDQTERLPVRLPGEQKPTLVTSKARFYYSPQIIYLVAAVSVVVLYSMFTTLVSLFSHLKIKPGFTSKFAPYFVIADVLLLGITASATGAGAGLSYVGLFGNKRIGWQKVCYIFDSFCWIVGSAIVLTFVASILQAMLILLPRKVHFHPYH